VKIVTATASVATAAALFPLVPKVFRLIDNARNSERRRIEIEQLNGELERFNYSVAHDLRAPLRGIRGFGQALREDYGDQLPPLARGYIEKMQQSAAQMDALISDLLKYATIGRQELAHAPVALDASIRSALALLDSEIRARGARLKLPETLPRAVADPTLVQVIFQNLIGNAIKFVAPNTTPEVEIAAVTALNRVRISITDNGLGIPADARANVFRIFERLHPEYSGTGIGLAIVHRAVERLGGRVGVEAAPSGTGTCFWFELPAA
jgi:signal transduction histidine kinase